MRFYKASQESGTHTGHIWGSTGTLLATVAFSGETASGWQTQNLTTPLSIAANTTYTVSVNTGGTYYVATNGGLASAITNGPLSTIVGGNGTYGNPGLYPTNTWQTLLKQVATLTLRKHHLSTLDLANAETHPGLTIWTIDRRLTCDGEP